jgi:ribosomal RNA-processing protein 9
MSSFFTAPNSQKKRKRSESTPANSFKRKSTAASSSQLHNGARARSRRERDESISGSESGPSGDEESGQIGEEEGSSSEDENETAAERRLRLAERYLENIREEVDPAGFDAADIDRDLIAERLKYDVAESKGKIYRHIASEHAFPTASHTTFRADQFCPTSIATAPPYMYTVAKDVTIAMWEIPDPHAIQPDPKPTNVTQRHKPKLLKTYKFRRNGKDGRYLGHTAPILCIAASSSGKYLATGGEDKKLVIWDARELRPLKVFSQHRDTVLGVSFRRNTHTLFSASADRTIKIWSLDEMAYIETLFGHQDQVVDIVGLASEKCISVGARDRTARLWKVIEESQLVFRGGGGGSAKENKGDGKTPLEGAIDRVAMIDEDMFVTGSDNGSISLWNAQRKKAVHTVTLAHGLAPQLSPGEASAELEPDPKVPGRPQARWITALATLPYSDLILSGSWDGLIRVWKISQDKRRIEKVGAVACSDNETGLINGDEDMAVDSQHTNRQDPPEMLLVRGLINDISVFERGDRGKDGLCIVAAVSKEHRLGKWRMVKKARCEGVVFEVSKAALLTTDSPMLNGLAHTHSK